MVDAPLTRNTERTRRAVLDAGQSLLRTRGAGVSVAEIATSASVSKSGLLHHFPSRDALFLAIASDVVERLDATVASYIDLSENHPGKVLRAYIRMIRDSPGPNDWFDSSGLWASLHASPGVPELLIEDERRWNVRFHSDGLHPHRVLVVSRAAEGLAATSAWNGIPTGSFLEACELLIAITNENGPLIDADRP